jgi:hypothetical protein
VQLHSDGKVTAALGDVSHSQAAIRLGRSLPRKAERSQLSPQSLLRLIFCKKKKKKEGQRKPKTKFT